MHRTRALDQAGYRRIQRLVRADEPLPPVLLTPITSLANQQVDIYIGGSFLLDKSNRPSTSSFKEAKPEKHVRFAKQRKRLCSCCLPTRNVADVHPPSPHPQIVITGVYPQQVGIMLSTRCQHQAG